MNESSLDIARLENVKRREDGTIIAACPACRASGFDKSGDHLRIDPAGKFGCAANSGDGDHRKEIFRLAGNKQVTTTGRSRFKIVAEYDYRDETGKLLYQVCRLDPKDFRQRKPDPTAKGGWSWKKSGVRRVPFRLPELLAAAVNHLPIFICEGEKDVLAVVAAGFAATCNDGGAGKWQRDFSDYLKRAEVFVIADKDEPGRKHAQRVAESLHGVAASVRILELPDTNGKSVKDAADFFAAGGDAAELDELAQAAPVWTPAPLVAAVATDASDFDRLTAEMRGEIIGWLMSKEDASKVRNEIAKLVVETLTKAGRFYFHAELRDFNSSMYFDSNRKLLCKIRGDNFQSWLSGWTQINRAENIFKFILAAVETAALTGSHTIGILPEAFWARRGDAIYMSNGDGQAAKITPGKVDIVDNGTDGVLFASGKTLAPWKLTDPHDVFESCRLFRQVHCAATHGKDLLRLWLYSLPTKPRSKPPLCLPGEIGSGKTRTVKGFAEFYGLPFVAQKVEDDGEKNFWPCVNVGGIYCMDNADTKCRWIADALANASTDGSSQQRRLYTNDETITLRANSWIAVTTANPTFANDPGLADRLLPVRMNRHDGDNSDADLSDEIVANRDAGLSHVAQTLSRALSDATPTPAGLNQRHPDFAAFAVRIGRALGREAEAITALKQTEADKSAFCLENDTIGTALLAYLDRAGYFSGTAAELMPKLIETDRDLDGWLSAKRLGKRLASIWPHLKAALPTCRKETDRKGFLRFDFRQNADFADFQTPFP